MTYALDPPHRYQLIAPRHCVDLGMKPEDLRLQAMANLRMRRPSLNVMWYPDAKAAALTLGGDLEAGLILDDGIVARLTQERPSFWWSATSPATGTAGTGRRYHWPTNASPST